MLGNHAGFMIAYQKNSESKSRVFFSGLLLVVSQFAALP
jgi:hypothetical protein